MGGGGGLKRDRTFGSVRESREGIKVWFPLEALKEGHEFDFLGKLL